MSFYRFEDFINACDEGVHVIVWEPALDGACRDFGIFGKEDLLGFIANGGLESVVPQNTRPWVGNPTPDDPIFVDSYRFKSMNKIGYLAFFFNHHLGRWNLKSFKRSQEWDGVYSLSFR